MFKSVLIYVPIFLLFLPMFSQTLDTKSGLEMTLNDGTIVQIYLKSNIDTIDSLYYYIPTNIHFHTIETGEKAYSILTFSGNDKDENGTIMHWILQWGLNIDQMGEVTSKLQEYIGTKSFLYDAVMVEWAEKEEYIAIIGDNSLAELLRKTLVNQSKIPLTPYSKSALAFKMNSSDSESFQKLWVIEKQISEVFIQMQFLVSFRSLSGNFSAEIIQIRKNLKDLMQQ